MQAAVTKRGVFLSQAWHPGQEAQSGRRATRSPCSQPDGDTRSGVVQVTRTSLPLVPGPTNGHLSRSHDSRPSHCQSCNEICMKQGCLAASGPVLINDSIHRCPTRNTFIIHYLFMQSILCVLIPPPAVLHWNEAKLKLCLKFKVVPLPRATCPLAVSHARLFGKWDIFFSRAARPPEHLLKQLHSQSLCKQQQTYLWHKVFSIKLFFLIMLAKKKKKGVLRAEPVLSDLNRS